MTSKMYIDCAQFMTISITHEKEENVVMFISNFQLHSRIGFSHQCWIDDTIGTIGFSPLIATKSQPNALDFGLWLRRVDDVAAARFHKEFQKGWSTVDECLGW